MLSSWSVGLVGGEEPCKLCICAGCSVVKLHLQGLELVVQRKLTARSAPFLAELCPDRVCLSCLSRNQGMGHNVIKSFGSPVQLLDSSPTTAKSSTVVLYLVQIRSVLGRVGGSSPSKTTGELL